MSRNKARVVAMQALFQIDKSEGAVNNVVGARAREETLDPGDAEYIRNIIKTVRENLRRIDGIVGDYSTDWPIGRLGGVELAVLRISLAEILYLKDVPASVAVSEAVRIAKKFGTENSGRYVNGILGKFLRDNPSASSGGRTDER
ncbi:MAG: transcription antitermination factor NusB [bacterium]